MNRELVLAALAAFVCGPALLLGGLMGARPTERDPFEVERRAWDRLWLPLLPAALLLALLVGWALQEPDASDEVVAPFVDAIALSFALVWLRAWVRALRALAAPRRPPGAATIGLFRPRVIIAPELAAVLDPRALAAVAAHEAAHARHRDPLRIWLAQLATDLQWPAPGARARLSSWRAALEVARDAEACAHGTDGADLAAAIVMAARQAQASVPHVPGLVDPAMALRDRVARLLARPTSPSLSVGASYSTPTRWPLRVALFAALALAVALGAQYGDILVRALPGVIG